jgi:hypothetical protein
LTLGLSKKAEVGNSAQRPLISPATTAGHLFQLVTVCRRFTYSASKAATTAHDLTATGGRLATTGAAHVQTAILASGREGCGASAACQAEPDKKAEALTDAAQEIEEDEGEYIPEPPEEPMHGPDGAIDCMDGRYEFVAFWLAKLGFEPQGSALIFGEGCGLAIIHPETGEALTPAEIARRVNKPSSVRKLN